MWSSLGLHFTELDYTTKKLQRDYLNLADARVLFDTVLEDYPEGEDQLGASASIVHVPDFESGFVKLIDNQEVALSESEFGAVSCFKVETSMSTEYNDNIDNQESITSRARKKRKLASSSRTRYMSLGFVLPTTKIYERLFSVAGFALSDRRQGILPANFEKQMYLTENSDLWAIDAVHALRLS